MTGKAGEKRPFFAMDEGQQTEQDYGSNRQRSVEEPGPSDVVGDGSDAERVKDSAAQGGGEAGRVEDAEDGNGADGSPEEAPSSQSKNSAQSSLQWDRVNREELSFRKKATPNGMVRLLRNFLVNGYSAVLVFVFYLISMESLLSILLSVSVTVFTYRRTEDDESFDGGIMNWILLSFSVITPMSSSISMAFGRRERAINDLAVVRSTLRNIYMAHACWDWAKASKPEPSGRSACNFHWLRHSDGVLEAINLLCEYTTRQLTLPSTSRARHRVTGYGIREAKDGRKLGFHLHRSALIQLTVVTKYCETLKAQGLPPNEATRIRQWERTVNERLESLRSIKDYRTPQALRSFARLFSVFLPPFYAPYYAELARQLNSLPMAVAFSVLTSIALTSLFECVTQMEDPFIGLIVLDGIDVEQEFVAKFRIELLDARSELYPGAPAFVESDSGRDIASSVLSPSFAEYRLFAEE